MEKKTGEHPRRNFGDEDFKMDKNEVVGRTPCKNLVWVRSLPNLGPCGDTEKKRSKISGHVFNTFCRLSVSTHTRDLHSNMNHDGETRRAAEATLPPRSTVGTFSVERQWISKYCVT
ncbi:unnamed protein product, partial [Choristocarpus tenellus]